MKRIQNIINPKGIESERLQRKEERILRQVDQAADALKDQIADLEEGTEVIIDGLGKCADADGTAKMQNALNQYCEKAEQITVLKHYVAHLNTLKEKLVADVKVTPIAVPVEVVNDKK